MDPYLSSYEYLYGNAPQGNKENSKTLFIANEASRNNWVSNRQTQNNLYRNPQPYWNRKTDPKPQPFGYKYASNNNTKK
jgi:hypothetical protein